MNIPNLVQQLAPYELTGLAFLLGWILLHVGTWMRAKAASEKAGSLAQKAELATAAITDALEAGIQHVEATLRPMADQISKDGVQSLTPDAKKRLRDAAIQEAVATAQAASGPVLKAAGLDGGAVELIAGKLLESVKAKVDATASADVPPPTKPIPTPTPTP